MSTKHITFILLSFLYIVSFITWGYVYKNTERRNKKLVQTVKNLYSQNTLLEMDLLQNQTCSSFLDPDLTLFTEKNKSIHLREVKPEGITLVFRYSILGCTPCVDEAISKVKEFLKQNPGINVLTLATYTLPVELRNFKRLNREFKHIYHVKSLDLSIEDEAVPYLFLLDDDMKISNTFILRKEFPRLTANYLEQIKKYLMHGIKVEHTKKPNKALGN